MTDLRRKTSELAGLNCARCIDSYCAAGQLRRYRFSTINHRSTSPRRDHKCCILRCVQIEQASRPTLEVRDPLAPVKLSLKPYQYLSSSSCHRLNAASPQAHCNQVSASPPSPHSQYSTSRSSTSNLNPSNSHKKTPSFPFLTSPQLHHASPKITNQHRIHHHPSNKHSANYQPFLRHFQDHSRP